MGDDDPRYNGQINDDGSITLTDPVTGEDKGTYYGDTTTNPDGTISLGDGALVIDFEEGEGKGAGAGDDSPSSEDPAPGAEPPAGDGQPGDGQPGDGQPGDGQPGDEPGGGWWDEDYPQGDGPELPGEEDPGGDDGGDDGGKGPKPGDGTGEDGWDGLPDVEEGSGGGRGGPPPGLKDAQATVRGARRAGRGLTDTNDRARRAAGRRLGEVPRAKPGPGLDTAPKEKVQVAEPVDLASGAYRTVHVDAHLAGIGPALAVARHYSNQLYSRGSFGAGWDCWWDATVRQLSSGAAYVRFGDTTGAFFGPGPNFEPQRGVPHRLTRTADTFTVRTGEDDIVTFDAAGRASVWRDPDGVELTVTRAPNGRPNAITHTDGRELTLTTSAQGHITRVVDTLGRAWRYNYDGDRLAAVTEPATPSHPTGPRWSFDYASSTDPRMRSALTAIRDADGTVLLRNLYGAADPSLNRVEEQTWADGTWRFGYQTIDDPPARPSNRQVVAQRATVQAPEGTRLELESNVWGLPLRRRQVSAAGTEAVTAYRYDTQLRLIEVTLPAGNRLAMTWTQDAYGRPHVASSSRRPATGNGLTTRFDYNGNGQMVGLTTPGGTRISYVRNARGRVAEVHAPASTALGAEVDAVTRYEYDALGRATRITAPDGVVTEQRYQAGAPLLCSEVRVEGSVDTRYRWDQAGRLTAVTDAEGATASVTYDDADRALTESGPLGRASRYTYNNLGQVTTREVLLSQTGSPDRWIATGYSYDIYGRCVRAEEHTNPATPATWQFSWHQTGYPAQLITPGGALMQWLWNGDGLMLEQRLNRGQPSERVEQWEWDGNGRLAVGTDTLGRATRYTYDAYDRPVSLTAPNGTVVRAAWDADSHQVHTQAFDATGVQRLDEYTIYDRLGLPLEQAHRIIDSTGTPGATARFRAHYDLVGRPIQLLDTLGRAATLAWDGRGNLTSMTDPTGGTTRYERALSGRVTAVEVETSAAAGSVRTRWQTPYDALGRLAEVADPLGNRERYSYDTLGRLITTSYADGAREDCSYDDRDRMLRRTWVRGAQRTEVAYTWDADGRITALTDPDLNTTSLDWDGANNLRRITAADGTALLRVDVDAGDRPVRTEDAGGQVHVLDWDDADRLLRRAVLGGGADTYRYDTYGNVIDADNGTHRFTAAFDSLGRAERHVVDGDTITFDPGPDLLLRQATYPSGAAVSYERDAMGQPTAMTATPAGGTAARSIIEWGMPGQLTSVTHPNGLRTQHDYDRAGRLIRSRTADTAGGSREDLTLLRDAAGLIVLSHREGYRRYWFDYDHTGQLIERRRAPAGASPDITPFLPTGAGNQAALTALAASLRPGAAGRRRWEYTAGGDRTRVRDGAQAGTTSTYDTRHRTLAVGVTALTWDRSGRLLRDGSHSYNYDDAGRLRQVRDLSSNAVRAELTYDAFGRIRTITTPAGTTTRTYIGAEVVQENAAGGVRTWYAAWGVDQPLTVADDTALLQLHADQTWSVLAATDATGQVAWRADWDPFGAGTVLDAAFALTPGAMPDAARFQGRPVLTGPLIDFRARVADTELGRFIQPDDIYPYGDPNPYRLAGNNTLVVVDPTGELIWFIPIVAGLIIGAALSAWANRDKTGADFWVPVAAGAIGGAIGGAGLGVAGFAAGGAVTGAITGAYQGGKRGGAGGALVGGALGAVAGGVGGAVGGYVGGKVANAVTSRAVASMTDGALLAGATAVGLGNGGKYMAVTFAGTTAGGVAGGASGGATGGFVGATGQVLANGGNFEDAVVTGAGVGVVGARDGAVYGFFGGVGGRALRLGGAAAMTRSWSGVLGEEGEWWLGNQTLNQINNEVPGVGEPDAWGVPRLPWARPVFGDAKNTQKIPSANSTNGQLPRYVNGLPDPYNPQTNPGGNRVTLYTRPGVAPPTKGTLIPFVNQGLLQFEPLQQTVTIPPNPAAGTCAN